MSNRRDFKNKNTVFTGTDSIIVPNGTTGERSGTELGQLRYNTTTGLAEFYTSAGWQAVDAPPSITTISPTTFNGESGSTITVNGSGFKNAAIVQFINASGTVYNAATTTFINSGQLTATTPQNFTIADEPLDIKVVNPSGLAATLDDALDCGGIPSWSTASGSLGTFDEGSAVSTSALSASDPEGRTISFAETNSLGTASATVLSGAGLTLNSSTGAITGTAPSVASNTTYSFHVSASDPAGNKAPRAFSIIIRNLAVVQFYVWGAGGGSGSQQRSSTSYHTTTFYGIKEGGAGGFVFGEYRIPSGTQILLSVGQGGRGALVAGNPSSAAGGYNGGGTSTYSGNDAGGGGGGYSGVFLSSVGKSQNGAIIISPGGGGGAGGPGYPANGNDRANGGGGITTNGVGNNGERQYGYFNNYAGGGNLTAGGVGGDASVANGDGAVGSALTGANAVFYSNAWGAGGGGGGGWFGGGSGANDGDSWSGGGGGAGSAFVRGSGISYNAAGNASLTGITRLNHTFFTQSFGLWGDGTNTSYGSMRGPAGTGNARYPGGNIAFGGAFPTNPTAYLGNNGSNGVIVYSIDGGAWQTVNYSGSDVTVTV